VDSSADLLISVALILLSARLSAQAASRFGLPSVFGLLVAGVVLGPSATDLIQLSEPLDAMSHIGVVILLFVAGIETDLVELRKVGRAALLAAIGGVALPMAGGTGLALAFGYDAAEAVFVGTILTATSVTVSAHVLRELGHLQSRVGSAILGAAIIDDIIGVMVLTVVISLEGEGSALDLVRLTAFIPAALFLGYWLIRFDDAWAPLHAQANWSRETWFPPVSVWRAIEDAWRFGTWWLVDLAVVAVAIVGLVLVAQRVAASYSVMAWASLLVPLTMPFPDRPMLSIPRFTVVVFPVFWGLALLGGRRRGAETALVAGSAAATAVLATMFVNWQPVF